ncbi:hypothetical protein BJ742DRAFT_871112 [Cladochytrium replicatum]|nr:hypothetical protein BJ742DRAFT_871112 [Cladochytrium replicatum]
MLVFEKKDRLGGHAENYTDPATGTRISTGVVIWGNMDITNRNLNHLNVSYSVSKFSSTLNNVYLDFKTCQNVASPILNHDPATLGATLAKYLQILDSYPELNPGGGFNFTFSDSCSQRVVTSDLYRAAAAHLFNDVPLNAIQRRVFRALNNGYPTLILASTPKGLVTIPARKLLVSIPPTSENLVPFDLTLSERKVFSQLKSRLYTCTQAHSRRTIGPQRIGELVRARNCTIGTMAFWMHAHLDGHRDLDVAGNTSCPEGSVDGSPSWEKSSQIFVGELVPDCNVAEADVRPIILQVVLTQSTAALGLVARLRTWSLPTAMMTGAAPTKSDQGLRVRMWEVITEHAMADAVIIGIAVT